MVLSLVGTMEVLWLCELGAWLGLRGGAGGGVSPRAIRRRTPTATPINTITTNAATAIPAVAPLEIPGSPERFDSPAAVAVLESVVLTLTLAGLTVEESGSINTVGNGVRLGPLCVAAVLGRSRVPASAVSVTTDESSPLLPAVAAGVAPTQWR